VGCKTILIVDDSKAMRELLTATIETVADFRILEASTGFEAMRVLPREKVDIVLTDINMPDINGLELISYMRNSPSHSAIPIIIISTEGSHKDIEKGTLLGANEYLVKPFDPADLKHLITKYLGEAIGKSGY